jgi:hypothetical protein
MAEDIDATMAQARLGEFDPEFGEQAKQMTAQEFARHHKVTVEGLVQYLVTVGTHDYYWSKETGKFDGWGRSMVED